MSALRLASWLFVSAGLAAWATADADVKIVAHVTVSQVTRPAPPPPSITVSQIDTGDASDAEPAKMPKDPAPLGPTTVTVYFHGGNSRTEADGTVTILDGQAGKLYFLDPSEKTYYIRALRDFYIPPRPGTSSRPLIIDGNVKMAAGSLNKTVAGTPADVYVLSGEVTLRPEANSAGGGSGLGRRGRRGGGSGNGSGNGDFIPPRYGHVEVSGEFWLSNAVRLPDDRNAAPLLAIYSPPQGETFAFRALSDSLKSKRLLPLGSRVTLTHDAATPGFQVSVTTTTDVDSVSKPTLPDSMFQLPVGYTQIEPPPLPTPIWRL